MNTDLGVAYHQIAKAHRKYFYQPNKGKMVFHNGWSWVAVFEATNQINFAVVKYYSARYDVVEI